MFRCKVFRPFCIFICLKFYPQYWYLLLRTEKIFWFSSYFWQGKGRNFVVSLQNCKNCVCIKYLTLDQLLKSIVINFTMFLYSMQNTHNSSIAKNLFILQFFEQIKLCLCFFSKKYLSPQKMLMSCLCLHHGTNLTLSY